MQLSTKMKNKITILLLITLIVSCGVKPYRGSYRVNECGDTIKLIQRKSLTQFR